MRKRSSAIIRAALAAIAFTISFATLAMAGTETILHSFSGGNDGGGSQAALVSDSAGNLYGVASYGGPNLDGVVFELTPDGNGGWNYNVIYSFTGGSDGYQPIDNAGLAIDSQGNLYGTTQYGGSNNLGNVFELSKGSSGWTVTKTYEFTGGHDGLWPTASVLLDSAGNVYGTAVAGGTGSYGTVFKLTPSGNGWTETTLHAFTGGVDGGYPTASLIMDRGGNLYGTSSIGGTYQQGNVFQLHPAGNSWTETVLYSFTGAADGSDGSGPIANLTFDSLGRIYGTTPYSGPHNAGFGGVFKLSPPVTIPRTIKEAQWKITWLYHFTGGSDGGVPSYGVIADSQGNLYGSTQLGGTVINECTSGCGVVFELSPSQQNWAESVLYSFTGGTSDGTGPAGNLLRDHAGNLFGTSPFGGAFYADGTVFKVTP
jgi:uncharacterized repeat protein (TIGR03803 family)